MPRSTAAARSAAKRIRGTGFGFTGAGRIRVGRKRKTPWTTSSTRPPVQKRGPTRCRPFSANLSSVFRFLTKEHEARGLGNLPANRIFLPQGLGRKAGRCGWQEELMPAFLCRWIFRWGAACGRTRCAVRASSSDAPTSHPSHPDCAKNVVTEDTEFQTEGTERKPSGFLCGLCVHLRALCDQRISSRGCASIGSDRSSSRRFPNPEYLTAAFADAADKGGKISDYPRHQRNRG